MYWWKSNLLAHKSRPHHFDGPEMVSMKQMHKYIGEVVTNHIGRTGIWYTALQARFLPEGLDVDF